MTPVIQRNENKGELNKFILFREIFERLVKNCRKHYIQGQRPTIDEQLLGFLGNCPFRLYISNKPATYGMKIIMMCDADTYYMCNAMIYHGKKKDDKQQPNIAQQWN